LNVLKKSRLYIFLSQHRF